MRTITLELLRHGPAHNQLLSPLTPYLALCENHGAVTIHVPFEHNQFLHRLDALGYRGHDEDARVFQLKDTAAVLGELLGLIPGLTAEANKQDSVDTSLTHLRLIISASELALLPFDPQNRTWCRLLALSPAGLPGSGQSLLLQSQMPVCLTREIRRTPDEGVAWDEQTPRILFVAAAPPAVGDIPLEPHLLALRRAIQPWVYYYDAVAAQTDKEGARKRNERINEHFVFLPDASIEAIEAQCAAGKFTHVHILAHGIKVREGHDERYVLALHNARNRERTDAISGTRLATALRAADRTGGRSLARPTVVTLASCDSGNVGSVAGAGASIAHALHEAGIAMVIAGQFPLSFDGSVRLVEGLYDGLLRGVDPRHLIHDVRRRLYSQFPQTHDWASLTAYLSLPLEFERQLAKIRISQAVRSFDAAMSHADEVTRNTSDRIQAKLRGLPGPQNPIGTERAKLHGLLASAAKRQAEVLYRMEDRRESDRLLVSARDHYWSSFLADRALYWAVVQYLSLSLIIANATGFRPGANPGSLRPEKRPGGLWSLARMLSLYDLQREDQTTRAWAHGNLIELYLLSLLPELRGEVAASEAKRRAIEHTDQLTDTAGWNSFEVYSTRRQILRYLEWYQELAGTYLSPLMSLAEQIFERLPAPADERYE